MQQLALLTCTRCTLLTSFLVNVCYDWLEKEADLKSLILKAYRCEELTAREEFIISIFICSVNSPRRDESLNMIDQAV